MARLLRRRTLPDFKSATHPSGVLASTPNCEKAELIELATLLGWGGLILVALLGAAGSGVGGFFSLSATYLLAVAVVALIRGRLEWARLRSRSAAALAIGVALALAVIGAATAQPPENPGAAAPASPTTPSATSSVNDRPPTPPTAVEGTALAAAATLAIKGRAPKTGFSRDQFGQAWFDTDRNGCDTRNDILRRDLVDREMKNWCKVLAGSRSPDPYTGKAVRFVVGGGSEIDVDHVVALSDAWQKGAGTWTASKRLAFANDPLNLLAVDAGANRSKGDGDVATWLPPAKPYRCTYVARVVSVKVKYQVWVTAAERDAMVRVLSSCANTILPAPGPAPTTAALPKSTATATPDDSPILPKPEAPSDVTYENCTAVRSAGAAPIRVGDLGFGSHLDGDGDGVGCER